MKSFMDENFLLSTPSAKVLFDACKNEPIFDWHCHLSPKEIWENKQPEDIAELWLLGDHYKWRAMRSFGSEEKYITGDASHYEKFKAWCAVMPHLIGNPLYHWTHLELQRYFGIYEPLCEQTCDSVWERANAAIKKGGFSPRELIAKSNVKCVCTTDDAADTLEYHQKIKEDNFSTLVLPAFRPDKALAVEAPAFPKWLESLQAVCATRIDSFDGLKDALYSRIDFFASMGCRACDHGVTYVPFKRADNAQLNSIFAKAKAGTAPTADEADAYRTELLIALGERYAQLGWGMELHFGAMRNNNTRMFKSLGPDTGFDSVGDSECAHNLSRLLDAMESGGGMPKMILFTLNPKDNYVLGSMLGNFQSSQARSKLQFGSAWWFNDNYDGMREQMKALANLGVLTAFVGMVTDSRSFLSYPRHEYFRRILCELIGGWVEQGKYPDDTAFLSRAVKDIAYNNAAKYFGLE